MLLGLGLWESVGAGHEIQERILGYEGEVPNLILDKIRII